MKMHRWTGRYEAHLWVNGCKKEGQARKGRQGQRSIPVTSKNSVDAPSESSRGLQEVNARCGNNSREDARMASFCGSVGGFRMIYKNEVICKELNYRFSCYALKAAEADVQKIKFEDIYCSQVIGPLISCCEAAWIRVDLFSRMLQSSDYGVSREFSSEDDNIVHLVKI
ncbi:hypothetical protein Tco_1200968 [Tanacetum coccineum]